MAETQTVTVEDVSSPNAKGWIEVTFTDGTKASTKDEEVAKAAFQSRGSEAEAVIGESKNGNFTNRFLNQINGIGEVKPRRGSGAGAATPAASSARPSGGKSPDVQERIARQWAHGRAVELLVGSGAEYSFPLDAATLSALQETADTLLDATKG